MLIHENANQQLDVLVEALCTQLSLTETQHAGAARAYQTLGNWLAASDSSLARFSPAVYPQGSLPLGTSVKPRHGEEFDADGVCVLSRQYQNLTPSQAYDLVLARVLEHGAYRDKVEPRERCIRINYDGSFHLDIVPALPADAWSTRIVIPTRDRRGSQSSDPKGYESWFRTREVVQRHFDTVIAGDAEPMPPPVHPAQRPPLQRAVQLGKRRRDVFFEDTPDLAPKSILLTTLFADAYQGQTPLVDTLQSALIQIATRLPPGIPPRVNNPSNPEENLARHWAEKLEAYDAFRRFRDDFALRLAVLEGLRGLDKIATALRDLFDPDGAGFVDRALSAVTGSFQDARAEGQVAMAPRRSTLVSRVASTAAASIPRNSFYGDD
jgi:hypothetical protein